MSQFTELSRNNNDRGNEYKYAEMKILLKCKFFWNPLTVKISLNISFKISTKVSWDLYNKYSSIE